VYRCAIERGQKVENPPSLSVRVQLLSQSARR
jgi:hypothetical protein